MVIETSYSTQGQCHVNSLHTRQRLHKLSYSNFGIDFNIPTHVNDVTKLDLFPPSETQDTKTTWWQNRIFLRIQNLDGKSKAKTKLKSSASSLFTVPSFQLLGSDVIWVTSTVFYPLPYLLWCLASSCLLPIPCSRSSLVYLLAFYLPLPAPLLS